MSQINVIDIGAVGGLGTPWKSHPKYLGQVLSFEPNEPPVLTGRYLKYNCAIWHFDGEAEFFVCGPNGDGSSLLEPNFDWVRANFERISTVGDPALNCSWFERAEARSRTVCSVKRLDTVLEELYGVLGRKVPFNFLKSDTQSGEWFVLQGARRYLEEDCLGLELELYRYPLYHKMQLQDDVIAYLQQLGFQVAGRTVYQGTFGSQADYLFLRQVPRSSQERQRIELIESIYNPQGEERLIKQSSQWELITQRLKAMARRALPKRQK